MNDSKSTENVKSSKFSIDAWRRAGAIIAASIPYDRERIHAGHQNHKPSFEPTDTSIERETENLSI